MVIKQTLQSGIRYINTKTFLNSLPNKISIYFHEIEKKDFDALLNIFQYFKMHGYEFVSIDKFQQSINDGNKMIALTFDDGFKSWIDTIPLFKKYNGKGTFFLNTIFLESGDLKVFKKNINVFDESRFIDKRGIFDLISSGQLIGSHTHEHHQISRLKIDELIEEIEINLNFLSEFSDNINHFAIPYGMRRYVNNDQLEYLHKKFMSVSFGESGMQFCQSKNSIQRYPWNSSKSFHYNLINICTDSSIFNKLTLRSGLG